MGGAKFLGLVKEIVSDSVIVSRRGHAKSRFMDLDTNKLSVMNSLDKKIDKVVHKLI